MVAPCWQKTRGVTVSSRYATQVKLCLMRSFTTWHFLAMCMGVKRDADSKSEISVQKNMEEYQRTMFGL